MLAVHTSYGDLVSCGLDRTTPACDNESSSANRTPIVGRFDGEPPRASTVVIELGWPSDGDDPRRGQYVKQVDVPRQSDAAFAGTVE